MEKTTKQVCLELLQEKFAFDLSCKWQQEVIKAIKLIEQSYILKRLIINGMGLLDSNDQSDPKDLAIFKKIYYCNGALSEDQNNEYSVRSYEKSNLSNIRKCFLDNELRKLR